MAQIIVTDKDTINNNFDYVRATLSELLIKVDAKIDIFTSGARKTLSVMVPDEYEITARVEIADKLAEIIAVGYKYNYFKNNVHVGGLSKVQTEIFLTALISADFDEDKAYAFSKLKNKSDFSLDGTFNFQMQPLKKKWSEIVSYMPGCFVQKQLNEFIGFLLENRIKKVYVDAGKVYDSHYRRLYRTMLLGDCSDASILREVMIAGGGEVEIIGNIEREEESFLKEFYLPRITFQKDFIAFNH